MYNYTDSLKACVYHINKYLRDHPSVRRSVYALINNPGLAPRKAGDGKTPAFTRHPVDTKQGIAEALARGDRNTDIARDFGVSSTYVTKIRVKNGIPSRIKWGEGRKSKFNQEITP